jgi:hypothetical protein
MLYVLVLVDLKCDTSNFLRIGRCVKYVLAVISRNTGAVGDEDRQTHRLSAGCWSLGKEEKMQNTRDVVVI